jgi:spore coat protein CotH
VNSRDWNDLREHFDLDTYYPADLTWHGVTARNVGIRSRGTGTRNDVKPGLKVDINHYVSNQRFLGLTAFDLKNMYVDASMLRETVAVKLYAQLGLPTPREAHARLYVNNEYVGVYVIVEAIDRTFVSRILGAREASVETGGYLFKYAWGDHIYGFEYLGPDLQPYSGAFDPHTRETDAIVNVYGPIESMIRSINQSSDQDFVAQVGRYLDLPEVATYLAAETFTVEWDGLAGNWGTANFYMFRSIETGRSQLIPWDRDHAFTFIDMPLTFRLETNVLTRRLLDVPVLRLAFLEQVNWRRQRAPAMGGDGSSGRWIARRV